MTRAELEELIERRNAAARECEELRGQADRLDAEIEAFDKRIRAET
jgi:hypothetical protein